MIRSGIHSVTHTPQTYQTDAGSLRYAQKEAATEQTRNTCGKIGVHE